MNKNDIDDSSTGDKVESIDFGRIFRQYLSYWPWLLVSVIACLILSFFYLQFTTPVYNITSRVMVNDDKKGSMGSSDILGDLGGLMGAKNSVDNEVELLKTRDLAEKVVRDMNLNISYYTKDNFKKTKIYHAPFTVSLLKEADTIEKTTFLITPLENNTALLKSDIIERIVKYDKPIQVPQIGVIQIHNNELKSPSDVDYGFTISSIDESVVDLMQNLTIAATNKMVTVIDITLSHQIPKMGTDILKKLIEKYVQGNIEDKNLIADSTIKFIQNRLLYIGGELGDLEGNIQGFKEKNNLADMTEQSKLLVQNTSQYVDDLAKIETQINILSGLQKYLKDEGKDKRVLPSSILPTDIVFNGLIDRYNGLLLQRDRQLLSVTETNPVILNLDEQINNLRIDMLSNIENSMRSLTISKKGLSEQIRGVDNTMQKVPKLERNYLDLARQQQIKQQLYLFLMQKSEETAISKTSNISNSKTIDSPKADLKPFKPKVLLILLAGCMIGLILPLSIIYFKDIINNKIVSKGDIAIITTVPVIGEISSNRDRDALVVSSDSRSAIAEQFRALRTSLSFYLKSEKQKVILVTSSMSGEGKSFVSINLGQIFAMTGKKVLLIEMDLRKPGLSNKLELENSYGFTNYILDPNIKSKDIIKPLNINNNLFLMSSGPIPPNPSEILLDSRTSDLINELRDKFDYIIIDAPPIGLVTDAQLIESFSDICLYIVRQKYTLKDQINIVKDLHNKGRMKQLAIVVNDIQEVGNYGYGYGYGQGYGNYGTIDEKRSIFNKFFKKNSQS